MPAGDLTGASSSPVEGLETATAPPRLQPSLSRFQEPLIPDEMVAGWVVRT